MMNMDTTTAMMNNSHHHHHGNMSMANMAGGGMDHSGMNHSGMDHSGMDHSGMDHSGMDHSGNMNMHMDMGMKMYFHTGLKEYVLFEQCHTDSMKEMVIACLVIFLVAILYEGLKFAREVLLQRTIQERSLRYYPDTKLSSSGTSQEQMVIRGSSMSVSSQMFSKSHAVQTFLHILQVFISYCLMLVFMTYNVWLCVAVIVGAGFGYFIFGWKRAMVVDSNEHCH